MSRCPICKAVAPGRDANAAFPFCSARCRAQDLGRWFTGSYVVPGKITEREGGEPTSSEEPAQPAGRKSDD